MANLNQGVREAKGIHYYQSKENIRDLVVFVIIVQMKLHCAIEIVRLCLDFVVTYPKYTCNHKRIG